MLNLRRTEQLRAKVFAACRKYLATQTQALPKVENAEYTDEPRYPQIKDPSFKARKERKVRKWHQQIAEVPTVEEKMIKINMPRYYGYKVVEMGHDKMPYNALPAVQHYTRTVLDGSELTTESNQSQQLDVFVQALLGDIQEGLEYTHDFFSHQQDKYNQLEPVEKERALTQFIVEQIHRALINVLSADCQHLQEVEVDYEPRHEAFWVVGGIDPPKNIVKIMEGVDWQKDMAKDPVDRLMQYKGQPYLAMRHRNQLPSWKNDGEVQNAALAKEIPRYTYDPRTLGYVTGHQHGTNIPGYWPGSASGFGCVSYQPRTHALIRPDSYGEEDFKQSLHTQAIQTSYAWLLAQANYNGFNTFNELTYPMNTQTIITNGRHWSFYEYQLNTLLVHSRHVDENSRVNFCRGTNELQLYQEIDEKGKCIGLNEQVVRHLIKFYINAPSVQRSSAELQPYLGAKAKHIADYADAEQRTFLEQVFKHMTANRPRHLELPEIYLWEKIYKIDNKTRQMDARRRYFELMINPWKRTMDQHQKEYIPRALRPEGTKSKKKWKQTYYP